MHNNVLRQNQHSEYIKKTLNWRNWYLTVYAAVRKGTYWLLSGTLAGRRTESTLNGINIQLKGHTEKSKQLAGCIKLNKTKQQIVETREKKNTQRKITVKVAYNTLN